MRSLRDEAVERRPDDRASFERGRRGQIGPGFGERRLRVGQLTIRILQLLAGTDPTVEEVLRARLRAPRVEEPRTCAVHLGTLGGDVRRERRDLEPHEELAAPHGVAFGFRDLDDARGRRGGDHEIGARRRLHEAGHVCHASNAGRNDRLDADGDDRSRFDFFRAAPAAGR